MAYTMIPLSTDEHRETLRRMWIENSTYDTRTNVCARERFEWLYQKSAWNRAQTWLAVEDRHEAVIGYGSVVRSDRYFRGRVIPAGLPAVFVVDKAHRLAAAALAIQRALLAGGSQSGFDVMAVKPNDTWALSSSAVGASQSARPSTTAVLRPSGSRSKRV